MKKDRNNKKKTTDYEGLYTRWLPVFFAALALLIIILPLQTAVNSARAVLSYVFIPQLRAAHGATDYLYGVSGSAHDLLNTARQNAALKDEVARLKIQNAQSEVLQNENERLTSALEISRQAKWAGVWAKVAYREPSRRSTVIVDKGSNHGVQMRAPVIGVDGSVVGLLGKVVEVTPGTSKILLSSDEDFFATAFLSQSRIEGLAAGNGFGGMTIKYIPLEAPVAEGEKVYTSISSAIFPDGILIGEIYSISGQSAAQTFLEPSLKLAVEPLRVKEVLILNPVSTVAPANQGGKK